MKNIYLNFIFVFLFPCHVFATEVYSCIGTWSEKPWEQSIRRGEIEGHLTIEFNNPNPNYKTLSFDGKWHYNGQTTPKLITHFLSVISETHYIAIGRMMNVNTNKAPPSFPSYSFDRNRLELRRDITRFKVNETITENMGLLSCKVVR